MKLLTLLFLAFFMIGCQGGSDTVDDFMVSYPVDDGTALEIEHFGVDWDDDNDSRYIRIIRSTEAMQRYNETHDNIDLTDTNFSKNIYIRIHNNMLDSKRGVNANRPYVLAAYERDGAVRIVIILVDAYAHVQADVTRTASDLALIKGAAGKPVYITKMTAYRYLYVPGDLNISFNALGKTYLPASSEMIYAALDNNRSGAHKYEVARTQDTFETMLLQTDTPETAKRVASGVDWNTQNALGFAALSEEGEYNYEAVYLGQNYPYVYSRLAALYRDCADYKPVRTNPRVFATFDNSHSGEDIFPEVYTMTVSCTPFDANTTLLIGTDFMDWLFKMPTFYEDLYYQPYQP